MHDIIHSKLSFFISCGIACLQEILGKEPFTLMLIGTKIDKNRRQVSKEDGRQFAEVLFLVYFAVYINNFFPIIYGRHLKLMTEYVDRLRS